MTSKVNVDIKINMLNYNNGLNRQNNINGLNFCLPLKNLFWYCSFELINSYLMTIMGAYK